MSRQVMIYVQHLLGVGHLKRMALLSDALAEAGAEVALVSGGFPAPQVITHPNVRFEQLPPLRAADASFSALETEAGSAPDTAFKQDRTTRLLTLLDDLNPDILVVELFPLGRRQMRYELLPLLQRAKGKVDHIACSVRDIVNHRPKREAEALEWLNNYFDTLLVHGDEQLTPIMDSVPGIGAFGGRVVHTGYISETDASAPIDHSQSEILVTAGSGSSGGLLFQVAAAASKQAGPEHLWRFRHATTTRPEQVQAWQRAAAQTAIFEPVAPDFQACLARASLSISQFGYNTAVALLQSATPSIVIPFEGEGETEQLRRARAFRAAGFAMLRESELNVERLLHHVRAQISNAQPRTPTISTKGLDASVRVLLAK